MMASWGMRARFTRIIEKIPAPMNVNARLTQYTDGRMRIAARQRREQRDGRAERGDLREREVDEDDPPLDDVDAQIGVDAGEDQAGDERRRQELDDDRELHLPGSLSDLDRVDQHG